MLARRGTILGILVFLAVSLVLVMQLALAQGSGNPSDIVISEVMFNAITETSAYGYGEWVEIYNKGDNPVDLTGWQVRDNHVTKTITADMCPSSSCEMPAGACWLIAWDEIHLQGEFDGYTNPSGQAVEPSRTVFLNGEIGDGLSNSSDMVALLTSDGKAVDCVSWANSSSGECAGLSYVNGGGGYDSTLNDEDNGQSITNVGGQWYYHQINASPYDCQNNVAADGGPTAVNIASFYVRALPLRSVALTAGMALALLAVAGCIVFRAMTRSDV